METRRRGSIENEESEMNDAGQAPIPDSEGFGGPPIG